MYLSANLFGSKVEIDGMVVQLLLEKRKLEAVCGSAQGVRRQSGARIGSNPD